MKRILVIEDDDAVRGLILETLRLRDWQVLSAPDGIAGVQMAFRELPDLILCDIQMPRLDGYQVLKELRKTSATATTPFVFLTGMDDAPGMRQAMELGADDYLRKPFTVKELLAAVDARFRKEELLSQSSEQRLEELRGNLSFALPHELVTPLNSILGYSDLITESMASADVKEYAVMIRSAGERLQRLIEKFLLYATIELLSADPKQRAAALAKPVGETADVVLNSAERAAQQFKRAEDLRVKADPAQHPIQGAHLSRLVRELLENAFKFSNAGSEVDLSSGNENGDFVVSVVDRGRGLSPDQVRRIGAHLQFERQVQEQQGTGLGLAICRRIAELYGGAVHIESVLGERTCVLVRLPRPQ